MPLETHHSHDANSRELNQVNTVPEPTAYTYTQNGYVSLNSVLCPREGQENMNLKRSTGIMRSNDSFRN